MWRCVFSHSVWQFSQIVYLRLCLHFVSVTCHCLDNVSVTWRCVLITCLWLYTVSSQHVCMMRNTMSSQSAWPGVWQRVFTTCLYDVYVTVSSQHVCMLCMWHSVLTTCLYCLWHSLRNVSVWFVTMRLHNVLLWCMWYHVFTTCHYDVCDTMSSQRACMVYMALSSQRVCVVYVTPSSQRVMMYVTSCLHNVSVWCMSHRLHNVSRCMWHDVITTCL